MSRYEEFEGRISNQIHKGIVMTLGGAGLGTIVLYLVWLLFSGLVWLCLSLGLIEFRPQAALINGWVTWGMIWNFGWQVHLSVTASIVALVTSHILLGKLLGWRRFAYVHA